MNTTEETLEASPPFTEFERKFLVITVLNENKDTVSSQQLFPDFSQNTEIENFSHGSCTILPETVEFQEGTSHTHSTIGREASKNHQKITKCEPNTSNFPKLKNNILNDHTFLTSNIMPPTLTPSEKPDSRKHESSTSQLSTEKYQFRPHLTSLYMVSTPFLFHVIAN